MKKKREHRNKFEWELEQMGSILYVMILYCGIRLKSTKARVGAAPLRIIKKNE